MRADPEHRRPARTRRRADFLPGAKRAWRDLAVFARARPLTILAGTALFAAGLGVPGFFLSRAHIGLTGGGLVDDFGASGTTWLCTLIIARLMVPALAAAFVFTQIQSWLCNARPEAGVSRKVAHWARVAVAFCIVRVLGAVATWAALFLPIFLVLTLGRISALLALILLVGPALTLCFSAVRLSLAPAAMSLGLPNSRAESWDITRGKVVHMLGLWLVAAWPLAAAEALSVSLQSWQDQQPAPSIALSCIAPALSWLAVLLGSTVCGQLYKSYRLPSELRPDRRPSRHRGHRLEPVLKIVGIS